MVQYAGNPHIVVDELQTRLRSFCENHPIEKLELFGSVATEEAHRESDIDLLATFSTGIPTGFAYFGFIQRIENDLADLLGCKVDLLDRESVESTRNPIRRNEILGRALAIYERGA